MQVPENGYSGKQKSVIVYLIIMCQTKPAVSVDTKHITIIVFDILVLLRH